jgi:hypothetical protein
MRRSTVLDVLRGRFEQTHRRGVKRACRGPTERFSDMHKRRDIFARRQCNWPAAIRCGSSRCQTSALQGVWLCVRGDPCRVLVFSVATRQLSSAMTAHARFRPPRRRESLTDSAIPSHHIALPVSIPDCTRERRKNAGGCLEGRDGPPARQPGQTYNVH